jgi:DedD protein
MAFFKFRKTGDESSAAPRPPESIEAMRRRARHRLIGAGVLVLIGVVGFPLLFDTQPRPIAVDIPIVIPDRNKVRPLSAPARSGTQAPAVSGRVTTMPPAANPSAPAASGKLSAAPASAPAAVAEPKPEAPAPVAQAEPKPEIKPEPKPEQPKVVAKPDTRPAESAKAKTLLEGKPVTSASAAEGRFVVQVGAFADVAKARVARAKVEKAGLKTYTHVADTKDGKRIRVRVGPFGSRGEADKAASKIKGLDLPAAVLTL